MQVPLIRCLNAPGPQTEFKLFTVNEIVKGGSLGHGTAVPSKYDVDLVVYSEGKATLRAQRWHDCIIVK